jgi:hypothetical protein
MMGGQPAMGERSDEDCRLWLLVVIVDRLRTATSTPATLDAAVDIVRERLPDGAPAWSELADETRMLVERLVRYGWLRESSEGWQLVAGVGEYGIDEFVDVAQNDCH